MTSTEHKNERWLVTGASSGLGAAVVRLACARGASVLALDVDQNKGAELCAQTGAQFVHCDVGDPQAWRELVSGLADDEVPNRVHLNAGIQIAPPDAPLEEYQLEAMQLERYRRMMSVNVDGVVFGLHHLLPRLEQGAAIVVTSSLAGITPYAIDPLYAASKHAVAGLVRSLGPTLEQRGIRISALCPGGIDTAIIPLAQRGNPDLFMTTEHVAEEVDELMLATENGKTWAKVRQNKPAYIIRAPGDKGPA